MCQWHIARGLQAATKSLELTPRPNPGVTTRKRQVTRARNQQVSLDATPYYHCISRCVRRAWLCGEDPVSGHNFDHRKSWLVDRMKELAAIYAVDICAYAVMSNHYHLVLYVNQAEARGWSQQEVIERWTRLFPNNAAAIITLGRNRGSAVARDQYRKTVEQWRARLCDISWFMRCLNESIARQANREDDCRGRFWEGRFRSQALLDEKALVTCMAYVDLNPVRAGISGSPEECDFTSIQERLLEHARRVRNPNSEQRRLLKQFSGQGEPRSAAAPRKARLKSLHRDLLHPAGGALPFSQSDYMDLLQFTAARLRERESDASRLAELPARRMLKNLGVDTQCWMETVTAFHRHFAQAAGSRESLLTFQTRRSRSGRLKFPDKWVRGATTAQRLFGS